MGTHAETDSGQLKPRVSVIIPGFHSESTLARTLDSLERQQERDFEVLFINSSPVTPQLNEILARYPWVRTIQVENRLLPHDARNLGASMARGRLLLFTDPDVCHSHQWIRLMKEAHDQGHMALVGDMDCSQTGLVPHGTHITKYHFLLPGRSKSDPWLIPTANAGYDSGLFRELGGFHPNLMCADALLSWTLKSKGYQIHHVPGAAADHLHSDDLAAFLRERRRRGYEFMRGRMDFEKWKSGRKMVHLILYPVLVGYVMAVAGMNCLKSGQLKAYVRTWPVQFLGHACWCRGEAVAQWESLRGTV